MQWGRIFSIAWLAKHTAQVQMQIVHIWRQLSWARPTLLLLIRSASSTLILCSFFEHFKKDMKCFSSSVIDRFAKHTAHTNANCAHTWRPILKLLLIRSASSWWGGSKSLAPCKYTFRSLNNKFRISYHSEFYLPDMPMNLRPRAPVFTRNWCELEKSALHEGRISRAPAMPRNTTEVLVAYPPHPLPAGLASGQ